MNELKTFNERIGEEIKLFGKSTPITKREPCRKKVLGKDFECECEECQKNKKL